MTSELRPYPEVKDPEVPWLDRVPAHWELRSLRSLSKKKIANGVGLSAQEARDGWPRYVRITDIKNTNTLREDSCASLPPVLAAPALLQEGDLLVAAVGATYGKSFLYSSELGPCCYAGYLVRVTPSDEVLPELIAYWANSDYYWDQVHSRVIQSTIENLSASRVKRLKVLVPPKDEQQDIVSYLDQATSEIDQAIASKQRLIALMNEQKQSIISEAVTRGLDPTVETQDSGVPWLGQVPAHWETRPCRALFREVGPKGFADQPMLSVTINRGVIPQAALLAEEAGMKDSSKTDKSQYRLVEPGDLVYNKMRAWQGAIGVSAYRGIVSPAYVVMQLISGDHLPDYFHLLFRTPAFAKEAERCSYGIASDMWTLRPEHFKTISAPVPPAAEQKQIVSYLDEATSGIDKSTALSQREIDLLGEYRTRLISDVVTGKVDVRSVPGPLAGSDSIDEFDEPVTAAESGGAAVDS